MTELEKELLGYCNTLVEMVYNCYPHSYLGSEEIRKYTNIEERLKELESGHVQG